MLGRVGVGAHEAENPVGFIRVRGPDFRAVDQELIALVLGAGLQRCEVGTGAGLRVSLAPSNLAAGDFRQMLALLFFVAVFQQRGSEHPDAEAVERRAAVERAHFLTQNFCLVAREAAAAVLARPFGHCPPLRRHPFEPLALRVGLKFPMPSAPASVFFGLQWATHLGRAICFEPRARLFTKIFKVFHSYVWC